MKSVSFISGCICAVFCAVIWWCILTFIAFAITKSGGSGDWINGYKPYVIAFVASVAFILGFIQSKIISSTPKKRKYGR